MSLLTKEEHIQCFMNKYCVLCGTQSCVCHLGIIDEEAISHCGNYHGDILGIPKIKSLTEVFEEWEAEHKELWEEIKAHYKK